VRPWDRFLWGVEFTGGVTAPVLIGSAWDGGCSPAYPDEPTRPLLFTTRVAARRWCTRKRAVYADRTDRCAAWRFRPVRVRETVREARRETR